LQFLRKLIIYKLKLEDNPNKRTCTVPRGSPTRGGTKAAALSDVTAVPVTDAIRSALLPISPIDPTIDAREPERWSEELDSDLMRFSVESAGRRDLFSFLAQAELPSALSMIWSKKDRM
jgi:hypothetical protein